MEPTDIVKPPNLKTLSAMLDNGMKDEVLKLIKKNEWKLEIVGDKIIHSGDSTEAWLDRFITQDPAMLSMKDDVRKLATIQDEVLICGETGTGKELIARSLHGNRTGKFLAINCAGLPDNLIESELFGHARGAFTGAEQSKVGLMRAADNGTLFLDEIGEMPVAVQAKLLRAIQEKVIRRVGANVDEEINCRIVAATHRNLSSMVDNNTFRMDLYARLSTFGIDLSPLRERLDDVVPICESLDGGKEFIQAIIQAIIQCHIVGDLCLKLNVRSLQQYVKRFKVLGRLPV